jgi:hypothetical protein
VLEADERALEEDSSDDDYDDDESEDHVPLHWRNYNFSRCTVNTGDNVPWEYTENEVCVGAMYPSTAHLKDAVKQWSTLTLHREFRVVKSSLRIYDVCCIKDDCSFRVYAYMGKWDNYIHVKEVKGHTCTLDRIDARHRNISYDFVASHMYPHIVNSPEYAPKVIIGAIEEKFGYTIGYGKAYQTKKKVLEHRWGTYEASYHNLPSLLHTIVQMNPGSYYDIKDYPCVEKPGKLALQRSFLALGACVEAFKLCRPVICIDDTFLTGKYKGTILTVVAADSNNQLLPLIIAFAEGRTVTVGTGSLRG